MRVEAADIKQAVSYDERIKQSAEMLKKMPHESLLYEAVVDFLQGNPRALLKEMHRIQTEEEAAMLRFNLGPLGHRLNVMLQIDQAASAVQTLIEENYTGKDSVAAREWAAYFEERIAAARSILVYEPSAGDGGTKKTKTEEQKLRGWGERSFSSFTREEVDVMREAIEKLVHKLKNIVSRRYAVLNRGNLDVKKTLRAAAKYNGVPLDIRYRHKTKRKSRIVTLCDVSGSVWAAARFLLNLLYALQDCFDQVNSFVFIDRLYPVTSILEEYDIDEAVCRILEDPEIHYNASTDYGETFRNFKKNYMELLTPKTTVIIVGDGRTNYMNPEDAILGQIRERCRRVIWLNPEQESLWGTGDSEMRSYLSHCHEVRQCRNVNQLFTFIEELVL